MVENKMLKKRFSETLSILIALIPLSCSTVSMIKTVPEEAEVYIKGDRLGKTPLKLDDSYSLPEEIVVRFKKEGYVPLEVKLEKEISYPVGFAALISYPPFPILRFWAWKFNKSYTFKLTPTKETVPGEKPGPEKTPPPEQN